MMLTQYENFFTDHLCNELLGTARFLMEKGDYVFATNLRWNPLIVKDSFPVFMHALNIESNLYRECKHQIETKIQLPIKNDSIMIYYWTRLSYIPWHDDENHTGALTVYLNEEWDEDWGGYFLYKEDETIKAILPKKNFALLQQGGIKHATTPVHLNGGIRFTIQTFF